MNLEANRIKEIYKEELDKMPPKHAAFFLKFLECGRINEAYLSVYPNVKIMSASKLGGDILKKIGFKMSDYLEYMGHTDDKLVSALDALHKKDPDKYIEKIIRLRKLDVASDVNINIPTINIITSRNEDVNL